MHCVLQTSNYTRIGLLNASVHTGWRKTGRFDRKYFTCAEKPILSTRDNKQKSEKKLETNAD